MRLFLYPNALQKLSYSQNDFGHIISVRSHENPAFMRVSDISHAEKKRRKREKNTPGAGAVASPSALIKEEEKGKKTAVKRS